MPPVIIAPQPGQQTAFLSSNADFCLYGGAAGGGKSYALLLDALRGINDPDYSAVIIRKNFPQLKQPGGLIPLSLSIYPLVGGKFNIATSEWRFKSGAVIAFKHLSTSTTHLTYQGAQLTFIGWDELTHITSLQQFLYLFSRNRSIAKFNPWVRATCNPDADSWVAELVDWYIGQDGYPIPERGGVIRWFVVAEDKFIWADGEEELQALRDRYPELIPKSFTFIPAKLEDNKILVESDPGYKANLLMQHQIERERLYLGNWRIRPEAGKVFNRSWFKILPAPRKYAAVVRAWDMAATAREFNDNAFYTAGVLVGVTEDGEFDIIDAIAEQVSPTDSDKLMVRTAKRDGKDTFISWEEEPGSSGIRVTVFLRELLKGYYCSASRLTGDKLTKARPTATDAEHGKINLIEGEWCDRFLTSIHQFDGTPKPLVNDLTDSLAIAHSFLRDPAQIAKRKYLRFLKGES